MLKSIGTIQLALGTLFVVPAVTGQDQGAKSLQDQLGATLSSLQYLGQLRDSAASGNEDAIGAILAATEEPRDTDAGAGAYLETLRSDLSRLRFQLDRLLGDPEEVKAIMTMPASVVRTLGLLGAPEGANAVEANPVQGNPAEGAPGAGTTGPVAPATGSGAAGGPAAPPSTTGVAPVFGPAAIGATAPPNAGMDPNMLQRIESELMPLDSVSEAARRRGAEAISLEGENYVAAPVRLGRLYVRSGRPAEAIAVLERAEDTVERRYWLARAYQAQQRFEDAADLYRQLLADPEAATFKPHVERDLKFVEFSRQLRNAGGAKR